MNNEDVRSNGFDAAPVRSNGADIRASVADIQSNVADLRSNIFFSIECLNSWVQQRFFSIERELSERTRALFNRTSLFFASKVGARVFGEKYARRAPRRRDKVRAAKRADASPRNSVRGRAAQLCLTRSLRALLKYIYGQFFANFWAVAAGCGCCRAQMQLWRETIIIAPFLATAHLLRRLYS